jgi:4-azaleucine resistance transporter AzlC
VTTARSEVALGVRDSIPLGIALVPIGLAFGYAARSAGLDWWLAGLMSAVVYAGPSQFLVVELLSQGASTAAMVATTGIANLRYVLFTSSLARWLEESRPSRLLPLGHAVADGSYAVTITHCLRHPERPGKEHYLVGSFLVSFGTWVPATIAGALLGSNLPELLSFGLDFASPAIFIGFLAAVVHTRASLAVMTVAGLVTVAGNEFLPAGVAPLLAILSAAGLGAALEWTPRRASS